MAHEADHPQLSVGILIFDDVEVLDFCGPLEVLSVCRGNVKAGGGKADKSPFRVQLIAATKDPVTTAAGMQVLPQATLDEICGATEALDILILPGGVGTRKERTNQTIMAFIRDQVKKVQIVASVCTGSILLAESDILESGSRITTHWQFIDTLQEWYPQLKVEQEHSVIRLEKTTSRPLIYTSAGISAGIDMSFWLIKDLYGDAVARATAKHMEYAYPESFARRIDL